MIDCNAIVTSNAFENVVWKNMSFFVSASMREENTVLYPLPTSYGYHNLTLSHRYYVLVSSSTASCYIDLIIHIGILSKGLIYIPVTDIDK